MVHHGLRPAVTDEPDALIGHVRVCGGSGGNRCSYPELPRSGGQRATKSKEKENHN